MHILSRRSLQDDTKMKLDEKRTSMIIEVDLTKLRLNISDRYLIGKEIVKTAKKNSNKNVLVQYAFISDNKRKVVIYMTYDNDDDFQVFRKNFKRFETLGNDNIFSFNEGINVLQR